MVAVRTQVVRHEVTGVRRTRVSRVEDLTAQLRRITVAGDDLAGFTSLAADDHVKLCFPGADGQLLLPEPSPSGGVQWPDGIRPAMRDYTPRRYDPVRRELELELVVHGDEGPASAWAAAAVPGSLLGVAGPRGSRVVGVDYDAFVLAGDQTALPAIGRRLEELPPGARAAVVVEVPDAAEQIDLPSAADVDLTWVHRGTAAPAAALLAALAAVDLPAGHVLAWAAGESSLVRPARTLLAQRCGPAAEVSVKGYWQLGVADDAP